MLLPGYVDPDEIRDRLQVLYAKMDRLIRYHDSINAGQPDVMLLDEKQRSILLEKYHRQPGDRMPQRVKRTMGRTIDVLQTRLQVQEAKKARFLAFGAFVESYEARARCRCGVIVRVVKRGGGGFPMFPSTCWSCGAPVPEQLEEEDVWGTAA